jgi:hypothetical protein
MIRGMLMLSQHEINLEGFMRLRKFFPGEYQKVSAYCQALRNMPPDRDVRAFPRHVLEEMGVVLKPSNNRHRQRRRQDIRTIAEFET